MFNKKIDLINIEAWSVKFKSDTRLNIKLNDWFKSESSNKVTFTLKDFKFSSINIINDYY